MTTKKKTQIIIDIAMTVILPVLMAYELIGEAAHEWIGTAMFLMLILHNILNRQWYKNLTRGRYSVVRVLGTTINTLLFIILVSQAVSGIMMAKHTFTFFAIDKGLSLARVVHLLGAYWGFVLMSLHLGLHWDMLMRGMGKATRITKPSALRTVILRTATALLASYGIVAFAGRQIGSYLFLRSQFVFFDYNEPLLFFFIDYLAMIGLFVCVGYYTSKVLKRFRRRSQ